LDVIIHDLDSAAERAKVTPEVIRRWIAEGLRATPVGRVGRRGPRDYRIFDSWLIEFLERRSSRVDTTAVDSPSPLASDGRSAAMKARRSSDSTPIGKGRLWPKP